MVSFFSGGNSVYCNGEIARDDMINNDNWVITDGGKDVFCQLLPITWTAPLTAQIGQQGVILNWEVADFLPHEAFIIAYSTDGYRFTDIGREGKPDSLLQGETFSFIHKTPEIGKNYYRVTHVDSDGRITYSNMASVDHQPIGMKCFPTLISEVLFMQSPINTSLQIIDSHGFVIGKIKVSEGKTEIPMTHLPSGMYLIFAETGARWKVVKK